MSNLESHVCVLRRSALTSCYISDKEGFRIYFQDFDGNIREVRYSGQSYQGGTNNSIISTCGDAKYHTPLAAVASTVEKQQISLFYISKEDMLQGVYYDGHTWHQMYRLSQQGFSTNPASQLSCLRFGGEDKNLRLYFQTPDLQIRELCFATGPDSTWTFGAFKAGAIVGSGVACVKVLNEKGDLQEIIVFFQEPSRELRSHYYLTDEGTWNVGHLHVPNAPIQCGLTAVCHSGLGYNADMVRVFIVQASGKLDERYWKSDEEGWHGPTDLVPSLGEGKLCSFMFPLSNNPEIRLFHQGDGCELRGFNFQDRKWHYDHTLPCGD